ncbi:NAD(P)H-binding protein [Actinotalea sp. BY-33]|uniref:NAD(P)H-binding protein n=1 Tax=Actinotalea soli TaxID=2819234 RepID=A0A939LPT0_9CELL|nr:NAD(P)H-binding protein [Actinotalea soli]MBO1752101.1 NAD(P)H-binding protein [Actinotalea soli]
MRLAVFGATGMVGSSVVERALAEGHEVRALVRDRRRRSGRLPDAVHAVLGDARDAEAVHETVVGTEAVLSSLGGFQDPESMSIGTGHIITAMRDQGIRRLVVMQGYHLDMPGDPHNLGKAVILPMLWVGNRRLLPASRAMAATLQASGLDWTLVRSPRVTAGARTGQVRTGHLRLSPVNHVRVGDLAEVMLGCLTDPTTVGTAPMVSAAR